MIRRKTKSNPTDHDLISKLEVKKDFPPYGVKYEVYLGKRRIAFADIDHGSTEISLVQVNEGYKLRGVATFLYDHIEKDLGRKLKPSEALIEDGEAFWKARNRRRSNPNNNKIKNKTMPDMVKLIRVKGTSGRGGDKGGESWRIEANGERVGVVFINLINESPIGEHASIQIFLNKKSQGQQIGRVAYRLAAESSKYDTIYAHMRKSNIASQRAAEEAGFTKIIFSPQLVMVRHRNLNLNPKNARFLKTPKTKISR